MGLTTDHLSSCWIIQHTEDLIMMRAQWGVIATKGFMNWVLQLDGHGFCTHYKSNPIVNQREVIRNNKAIFSAVCSWFHDPLYILQPNLPGCGLLPGGWWRRRHLRRPVCRRPFRSLQCPEVVKNYISKGAFNFLVLNWTRESCSLLCTLEDHCVVHTCVATLQWNTLSFFFLNHYSNSNDRASNNILHRC